MNDPIPRTGSGVWRGKARLGALTFAGAACLLALPVAHGADVRGAPAAHYQATEDSLAHHPLPAWYADAKLGIFIHWGLYSVPGYAPREAREFRLEEAGDQQKRVNPYAEWYYNSMRIPDSPTAKFHFNAYGADFKYYQFAHTFNAATRRWDPEAWARLFREIGARYVVLTGKHHDGFSLWPSAVRNPHLSGDESHSERDLVGELTTAVRGAGLKMGIYYSGLYDWSFGSGPFLGKDNTAQAIDEQGADYPRYADAQWREIMRRYYPDILWNDIGYSPNGEALAIAAEFYNANPEGVINNRWQPFKFHDFNTPEYSKLESISAEKWEECRGLGKSFGLNRIEGPEETIAPGALIALLVDIVSKNGNLLLDVGPEPDGTIPALQIERLHALGAWLRQNGEAIFATHPWSRAAGRTTEGTELRFTARKEAVYVVLLGHPASSRITVLDAGRAPHHKATLLDGDKGLVVPVSVKGEDLSLELPSALPGEYAWSIRLE